MIIRIIGLSLFATAAFTPATAQDVAKPAAAAPSHDAAVSSCPGDAATAHSAHSAAPAVGKVNVQDIRMRTANPASSGKATPSGGGSGKVNVQDLHRTASPSNAGTAVATDTTGCAVPKP